MVRRTQGNASLEAPIELYVPLMVRALALVVYVLQSGKTSLT